MRLASRRATKLYTFLVLLNTQYDWRAIYGKFIVLMLRLLQVNEQGHTPYGKKRALILTNETRLLALI